MAPRASGCYGVGRVMEGRRGARAYLQKPSNSFDRCAEPTRYGAPLASMASYKLGITVAQRTVAKYMVPRRPDGRSQNWTTFLRNPLGQMVSVDFLTVPTVNFQVLYVFVILS